MKHITKIITTALLCAALASCGEAVTPDQTSTTTAGNTTAATVSTTEAVFVPQTTTEGTTDTQAIPPYIFPETSAIICGPEVMMSDDFNYSTLTLPDYKAENPVRYLGVDPRGEQSDGWQDFGTAGEIGTMPLPRMTYTYQMYSWFVRNDITHLYPGTTLPTDPAALAEWVSEYWQDGRNALWYSMTNERPQKVELTGSETLTTNGGATVCRARYTVTDREGKTRDWALYFLCENGTASVLGIRINEAPDTVISFTDSIIRSYRPRTN